MAGDAHDERKLKALRRLFRKHSDGGRLKEPGLKVLLQHTGFSGEGKVVARLYAAMRGGADGATEERFIAVMGRVTNTRRRSIGPSSLASESPASPDAPPPPGLPPSPVPPPQQRPKQAEPPAPQDPPAAAPLPPQRPDPPAPLPPQQTDPAAAAVAAEPRAAAPPLPPQRTEPRAAAPPIPPRTTAAAAAPPPQRQSFTQDASAPREAAQPESAVTDQPSAQPAPLPVREPSEEFIRIEEELRRRASERPEAARLVAALPSTCVGADEPDVAFGRRLLNVLQMHSEAEDKHRWRRERKRAAWEDADSAPDVQRRSATATPSEALPQQPEAESWTLHDPAPPAAEESHSLDGDGLVEAAGKMGLLHPGSPTHAPAADLLPVTSVSVPSTPSESPITGLPFTPLDELPSRRVRAALAAARRAHDAEAGIAGVHAASPAEGGDVVIVSDAAVQMLSEAGAVLEGVALADIGAVISTADGWIGVAVRDRRSKGMLFRPEVDDGCAASSEAEQHMVSDQLRNVISLAVEGATGAFPPLQQADSAEGAARAAGAAAAAAKPDVQPLSVYKSFRRGPAGRRKPSGLPPLEHPQEPAERVDAETRVREWAAALASETPPRAGFIAQAMWTGARFRVTLGAAELPTVRRSTVLRTLARWAGVDKRRLSLHTPRPAPPGPDASLTCADLGITNGCTVYILLDQAAPGSPRRGSASPEGSPVRRKSRRFASDFEEIGSFLRKPSAAPSAPEAAPAADAVGEPEPTPPPECEPPPSPPPDRAAARPAAPLIAPELAGFLKSAAPEPPQPDTAPEEAAPAAPEDPPAAADDGGPGGRDAGAAEQMFDPAGSASTRPAAEGLASVRAARAAPDADRSSAIWSPSARPLRDPEHEPQPAAPPPADAVLAQPEPLRCLPADNRVQYSLQKAARRRQRTPPRPQAQVTPAQPTPESAAQLPVRAAQAVRFDDMPPPARRTSTPPSSQQQDVQLPPQQPPQPQQFSQPQRLPQQQLTQPQQQYTQPQLPQQHPTQPQLPQQHFAQPAPQLYPQQRWSVPPHPHLSPQEQLVQLQLPVTRPVQPPQPVQPQQPFVPCTVRTPAYAGPVECDIAVSPAEPLSRDAAAALRRAVWGGGLAGHARSPSPRWPDPRVDISVERFPAHRPLPDRRYTSPQRPAPAGHRQWSPAAAHAAAALFSKPPVSCADDSADSAGYGDATAPAPPAGIVLEF